MHYFKAWLVADMFSYKLAKSADTWRAYPKTLDYEISFLMSKGDLEVTNFFLVFFKQLNKANTFKCELSNG